MARSFSDLSSEEVMALAIGIERANARRFEAFADVFKGYHARVSTQFAELAAEEREHETDLRAAAERRFGRAPPPMVEGEVKDVIECFDLADGEDLIFDSMTVGEALRIARRSEEQAERFYRQAAGGERDPDLRAVYEELAAIEGQHVRKVGERAAREGE